MHKLAIAGLLALSSSLLHAGELDDYHLIKSAHADQLYLFVEEKAEAFLAREDIDQGGKIAKSVRAYLISGLIERGAHDEALSRIQSFEKSFGELTPRITFLKARALFGATVEKGLPLPDGETRPSDLIAAVIHQLDIEDKPMALYVRGQDLFEARAFDQASLVLKRVVDENKRFRYVEDAQFLFGRSLYYLPIPLYNDALETFKELEKRYPNSPLLTRYTFWQAECYFEMNLLNKAEKTFLRTLDLNPDPDTVLDVHYNLGWLFVALGRHDDAFEHLGKVIASATTNRYTDSARYKMASIHLLRKQPESCLQLLEPLLDGSSLVHEASLLAAQANMARHELILASDLLMRARESTVAEVQLEALRLLGSVQLDLGNHEEAEELLKGLIHYEVPLDFRIDVQLQLADVYFEKGDVYRSQDIYRQLMAEKSTKLMPELHYNLALCALRTNPLVECVYRRDALRELEGGVPEASKESLDLRLREVLSEMWSLAASSSTLLNKPAMMAQMEVVSGKTVEELRLEIERELLEDDKKLPSDPGMTNVLFTKMAEAFSKAFWDGDTVPPYLQATESLGVMGRYYKLLQITRIFSHLDSIIRPGIENPYLPLAYREKAKLYENQSLFSDAIEALQHAIEATADPMLKADYRLELAMLEINLAKGIEGDPKSVKVKLQRALSHLREVRRLRGETTRKQVDLEFITLNLLLEYDQAEKVLLDFLDTVPSFEDRRTVEVQLINFYLQRDRPITAAQRRLVYASVLAPQDRVESHRQTYLAATTLLESKQGHEEGVKLLTTLAGAAETSEWSFRASLKKVGLLHRSGDLGAAEALLVSMEEKADQVNHLMRLEIAMTRGEQLLLQARHKEAAEAFKQVVDASGQQVSIKAAAMIEYGKSLKRVDPLEAAKVFLEFYYTFKDEENPDARLPMALYESCRLQISALKKSDEGDRDARKRQVEMLIAKLENPKDRQKLTRYLEGN